jgi:hypothetical protein
VRLLAHEWFVRQLSLIVPLQQVDLCDPHRLCFDSRAWR